MSDKAISVLTKESKAILRKERQERKERLKIELQPTGQNA
jgi:hypothetical protein